MDENTRWQKLAAEFLGTAFLVFVGVGSVPALLLVNKANGSTFSGSDLGIISLAFATIVIVTVYVFGYISGNHINPAVTFGLAATGKVPWAEVPAYVAAQVAGAFLGVAVAHVMFKQPALFFASQHRRDGIAQLVSEFVATFGLLAVIWGSARRRPGLVPFAVGAYISAAYWFTASTSFANPAVTLARAASDTFAGIRPIDAPGFIGAQLVGAAAATAIFRWLVPALPEVADRVVDRRLSNEELP